MDRTKLILIGALVLGGGVGVYELLGGEEQIPIYEYQVVPKAYLHATKGKYVRIVANTQDVSKAPMNTDVGRVTLLTGSVPADALCEVVFAAPSIRDKNTNMELTDVPELAPYWQKAGMSNPQMVAPGKVDLNPIWWTVLQGEGCVRAVDYIGYFGSSIKEFLFLGEETKGRFLKTYNANKEIVPYGDKDADPTAEVFAPFGVFGRERDLDFETVKEGNVIPKYQIPEGGFAELEEVEP